MIDAALYEEGNSASRSTAGRRSFTLTSIGDVGPVGLLSACFRLGKTGLLISPTAASPVFEDSEALVRSWRTARSLANKRQR